MAERFFGGIAVRCREGVAEDGRWSCPATAHMGLRANQSHPTEALEAIRSQRYITAYIANLSRRW